MTTRHLLRTAVTATLILLAAESQAGNAVSFTADDPMLTLTIGQVGDGNRIEGNAHGTGNTFSLSQVGRANITAVNTPGGLRPGYTLSSDSNRVRVSAVGDGNLAAVGVTGPGHVVVTDIAGDANVVETESVGVANTIAQTVAGDVNTSSVWVDGLGNYVGVAITGSDNWFEARVSDEQNQLRARIDGSDNRVGANQTVVRESVMDLSVAGDRNTIDARQGNGQGGRGNVMTVGFAGSDNSGQFYQFGSGNALTFSGLGSRQTVRVLQDAR